MDNPTPALRTPLFALLALLKRSKDSRCSIIFNGLTATKSHSVLLALGFCLLCACTETPSRDSRDAPAIGEAQLPLLGQTLWSKDFGGTTPQDMAYARSVAVDQSGNTLLAGEFRGTVFFNAPCAALNGGSNVSAFVAKMAPDGTCRWAYRYGDAFNDHFAEGVAVDSNGNVFVVGSFTGTMDFGCLLPIEAAGVSSIFLAKLSPDGVCRWSQAFGDANPHYGHAVAVDNAGPDSSVFITGTSFGSVDFGGGFIGRGVKSNGYDTYVAKFLDRDGDFDGLYQTAFAYGTSGNATGRGIAVDTAGPSPHTVVVTGSFDDQINFGLDATTLLSSYGQDDIFLAKLDLNLVRQWSYHYGDPQPQFAVAVATDSSHNIVLTGGFLGRIPLDGGVDPLISSRTGKTIFLITFYANGLPRWAKQFGEVGDMWGSALAIGPGNSIFLTGPFRGSVTFPRASGSITLQSGPDPGSEYRFLAKFAPDLRNFDASQFGTPVNTYSSGVGVDPTGNVLFGGSFTGTMTFGGQSVVSHGNKDIFLAKTAHQCDGANCDGCCNGNNSCQSPSVQSCGIYGSQCLVCPPNRAECVAGQCQCGSGPPCADGLRCDLTLHSCVCDAASCNGCCNGGTSGSCQVRDRDHCAATGQACQACSATAADRCLSDGSCSCGGGPTCGAGASCVSAQCVCDECGPPSACHACPIYTCPCGGTWPYCDICPCPPGTERCCGNTQCCAPGDACRGPTP